MKNHNVEIENHVVLFTDIHNFSIAVNALGKDQYGFLQEFYEKLGDVIVAHDGEIIKYLGDAILCIFDSESQAVESALKMRQVFSDIVTGRNLSGDTELEIGISAGEAGIGIFGHKSLMQRDVFGVVVNQAAMIGHHRGVAITESVYDKIKTHYETNRLPDFEVKWQDEPLKIWEIVESSKG
ncbi:MAG: adenylate/guanylate cyclase domain-containing protein [Chloroflexi bacterium]|nr:adenylate/guanylate cyclase domain-containing protein [Chloroflexota bacterium]